MRFMSIGVALAICVAWVVPALIAGRVGIAALGWLCAMCCALAIALLSPMRGGFDPVDRPGAIGDKGGGWYRPPGAIARRRGMGGGRILGAMLLLGLALACAGAMLVFVTG